MEDLQQMIVNEHIGDLRREAESIRTERRVNHRTRDGDGGKGSETVPEGDREGARVRLGHWLIGVGIAVAGHRQQT
jgi:hypothetical protein